MELKKCSKCGKILPITEFSGQTGYCKTCRRDYDWQYRYGLSPEQYMELQENQKGKCKICGKELESYLNIDHNKDTGEVRGLLCPHCNKAIGLFHEDTEIIKNAIKYLKETNEGSNIREIE